MVTLSPTIGDDDDAKEAEALQAQTASGLLRRGSKKLIASLS